MTPRRPQGDAVRPYPGNINIEYHTMNKNFVEELKWRGMLSQIMPGTEELLMKEQVTA